jgi:hypothetical protein
MQIIQKGFIIALIFVNSALQAQFSVNIEVTQNISCYGGTNGSLTAVVAPAGSAYTFSWSNGGNTANLADLSAGAYSVTVQNVSGGIVIASTILSEPSELILTSLTELPLSVNPNGSVDIETSGGTAPYSYQWVNAANIPVSNTEDLVDAPASIYTLTGTDDKGCTATLTPVTLVLTSGTQELQARDIQVFPNPATKDLSVEIQEAENVQVLIFNSIGQKMEQRLLQGPLGSFSVENWPEGCYHLVLPELSKTIKFIVEH